MSIKLDNVEYLYKSYYNKLKFFFLKSGITNETAEELCQETFMKVYNHRERFDSSKGSESTWVYSIARNELIDYFRKSRKEKNLVDFSSWENLVSSYETSAYKLEEEKVLLEKLSKSIHLLKEPEKSIVILHCIHGKSIAETSSHTGIAQRTISRRLVSALKLLREELQTSGIDESWLQGGKE
ncbi:RNA polymerase sigma factor [Leptospira yasudae]|uniref:Sigma-70 family RNA polymerase sigma factor n=1 Tax=Leptospira yasudae TaxID=2202201 RepID=A0A6N4QJ92_9LEPT|nr:sigma-70 family RNA polymerase sigma factor [Leptospira yasudae]TGL82096.1 sigma-70 family RNA polymerase sigma factor [Leptospira yasudae]TGL83193.1 sigma-70 family RNA polymerase sigma factor [Leptospira yasudae]TGL87453.1 sigma-70 family RNA polymerase sigma factor [Leptospira yasudae]